MKNQIRIRKFALFMILVMLLGVSGMPAAPVHAASTITFTAEELLTRPTDTSININVVPAEAINLYYEYGTVSGGPYSSTPTVSAAVATPCNVVIDGLTPDTKYFYRMQYQKPGDVWVTRDEHSFHTQRAPGDTFSFVVTSDTHAGLGGDYFSTTRYNQTLGNILAEHPDFWIDTGDTPPVDFKTTSDAYQTAYKTMRGTIKAVSGDVPFFQVLGNHEQEMGWNLDDKSDTSQTQPILEVNARRMFFPDPKPDSFYSGNLDTSLSYIDDDHLREDYFAFTWGDALFIALDPYWYTMTFPSEGSSYPFGGEESPNTETPVGTRWDWALGLQQYLWLKNTLATSTATYKFVFIHNVTGGIIPYGRGGAEIAGYFEWGGYNWDGTWGWDTHRSAAAGWTTPIHQLMQQYHVSVLFHGHDHFYAKQTLDGIVYQEVPMPAAVDGYVGFMNEQTGTYESQYPDPAKILFYGGAEKYPDSGHLRVTVSPTEVTVDYVRLDDSITASYTIPAPATNVAPIASNDTYATNTDTVLNVPAPGVLGNDTDADSDALTANQVSGPAHGDLAFNSDGSFTYTPEPGFTGEDTFTYIANDGTLDSNTATVTILVNDATQSIPLVSGWNLVSFNIHPASSVITDVLAPVAGNYSLVYAWYASTGSWMRYDPNAPVGNTLASLDESMGFWIKMNTAATLVVSGSEPGSSNVALSTSWNLVGFPSRSNQVLPDAFNLHGVGNFNLVYAYHANDSSDPWKKYNTSAPSGNDLPELAPGWGYWVDAGAACTWDVSY